jgi:hypothetical protein
VCSLIGMSGLVSAWAQKGGISGVVLDSATKPVGGATVLCKSIPNYGNPAVAQPPAVPTPVPVSLSAVTDSAGAFRIAGLPAGAYYVCAVPPSSGLLSSCSYAPKLMIVEVGAGQQVGNATITMLSGAVVRVQVMDAGGKIPQGHRFSVVSMAGDGTYEIGIMASQTTGETDYELTIPKDRTSRLMVQTDLTVTDASGASVPLLQPVIPLPIASASAGSPLIVTLTVP